MYNQNENSVFVFFAFRLILLCPFVPAMSGLTICPSAVAMVTQSLHTPSFTHRTAIGQIRTSYCLKHVFWKAIETGETWSHQLNICQLAKTWQVTNINPDPIEKKLTMRVKGNYIATDEDHKKLYFKGILCDFFIFTPEQIIFLKKYYTYCILI